MRQNFSSFLCVAFLSLSLIACSTDETPNGAGDYVVLFHGVARNSKQMNDLEEYLQKQGYDVINQNFASTKYPLETLTLRASEQLTARLTEDKPVHFVGFSTGGLLVRAIIHKQKPENLGRVVQLATPNHGSEVSDFFKDNWLYQEVLGPAGQQLITDQQKIEHLFGEVNYELGVIAGNNTINPVTSIIIPDDDDGMVSIKSTKLKGMKDHIVLPVSHTFAPSNEIVHQQIAYFLKNGVFKRD